MKNEKLTYFLSDAHLGSLAIKDPIAHERKLVQFLDSIKDKAAAIYLLGDMFDFWFEYRMVVPKGHVRFLGKLAELTDRGVEVHFFTGNHDIWTFGYLERECGVIVHRKGEVIDIMGHRFFLAHGDGLNDRSFDMFLVQTCFHSRFLQFLFSILPPYLCLSIAHAWSRHNRIGDINSDYGYKGEDNEPLARFAKEHSNAHPDIEYYVFGHRHILLNLQLRRARMVILGDWFSTFSYATFDGTYFNIYELPALRDAR